MSDFASIADLELPVVDDFEVPSNPEEYAKQADPAPLAPGNYRFVVTKSSLRKERNSETVQLTDGKFLTYVLNNVKLTEPVENERGVALFQDVREKPLTRKNSAGADSASSELFDLLLAYDAETYPQGTGDELLKAARELFQQYQQEGKSFVAQIKWTGWDKDYVDAEFAKIGGKERASKDVAKAIYDKARKNTRDFIVNGVRVQSIIGPSGNPIQAKAVIARYFPSNELEKVKLGPFGVNGK